MGGDLLSINSLQEHYFISGGLSGKSGEENCIAMSAPSAWWYDDYCSTLHGSICKKRAGQVYGCPGEEWSGYRLSCFFVARNKTAWSEAQSYCKAAGGDLASILDEGEQAFVHSLLPKRAREEDGFCVSMSANHPVGLWSTFNCTTLSSFICEFPRVGFTTPTTAPPTTTLPKSCETGWLELDGNCYKIFPPESWMEGRDSCRRMGAELVSIHTDEENEFVFRRFVE
uniref:C-type mannose receptor 2 n=1 Tax=Magallana gigas TaxID=29159 RepID=K1QSM5_MAGGI